MKKWMILEWGDPWFIPDHRHGGANSGPYESIDEAKEELTKYAERQVAGWKVVCPEICERERAILVRSLRVIELDWPTDDPFL